MVGFVEWLIHERVCVVFVASSRAQFGLWRMELAGWLGAWWVSVGLGVVFVVVLARVSFHQSEWN